MPVTTTFDTATTRALPQYSQRVHAHSKFATPFQGVAHSICKGSPVLTSTQSEHLFSSVEAASKGVTLGAQMSKNIC